MVYVCGYDEMKKDREDGRAGVTSGEKDGYVVLTAISRILSRCGSKPVISQSTQTSGPSAKLSVLVGAFVVIAEE